MSIPQPSNFTIIPAVVRYANITDFAKILYSEILSRSKQKGYCYTSNKRLSELFGISDTQNSKVKRAIAQLIKAQFIQTQSKSIKRRIYPLFDEKSEPINIDSAGTTTPLTKQYKTTQKLKIDTMEQQQSTKALVIPYSNNLQQAGEIQKQPVINKNDQQPNKPMTIYSLTDMSSTNNWCNYALVTTTHTIQKYTYKPCKSAPDNKKENKEKVKSKLSLPLDKVKNEPVQKNGNTNNLQDIFQQWGNVINCFSYHSDTFKITMIEYVRLLQKDRKVTPAYLKKANEFITQYAKDEKQAIQVVRQAIDNFMQQKGSIRPLHWQPATTKNNQEFQTPSDLVQHINSFSDFWQFEKWLNNMILRKPKQVAYLYHKMNADQKKNIKNGWFYDLQRMVNKVKR